MNRPHEHGFTAVEILITLFIGSLLLFGGYQAYSLVVGNTSNVRERTIASNYAYDALRRFEALYAKSPCVARAEANFPSGIVPISPDINITAKRFSISCPYGSSSSISKIITKITYGNPSQEVVHAIYTKNS